MVFNNAKWIKAGEYCEAPMFRKEFIAENIFDAVISICGLGFFELYINGERISEDLLMPAWSDYEKREFKNLLYPINDIFTYRIYYRTFNITKYLVNGINTIGVVLGNGWYNQHERNEEGNLSYGEPKLCYSIKLENNIGTKEIVSDESDRWDFSDVVKNNIFFGECHDARLIQKGWNISGFDASRWKKPIILPAPDSNITLQDCPSDRRIRTLSPVLISNRGNIKIYDMGENNTAWVRVRADARCGDLITVRYAEELNNDGTLNFDSSGSKTQIQKDEYICNDGINEFEPRFSVRAFRYFEITGNAEPIVCTIIHTNLLPAADFKTDDEIFGWLYDTYSRTQLSNIHYGVPSDCPHRERLGYTGDGQITSDAAMLLFDCEKFYTKWIQDIIDCQDPKTGHIQHTAPFYGGGGGPGGWGGAIVFVPYNHYKHYKNKAILQRAYSAMKAWVKYLESHSEDYLVVSEEEGGWCLGDWAAPKSIEIPAPFVNTYFFVRGLECMVEIAGILGKQCDAECYADKINKLKDAINRHYFDNETGSYCEGVQGSDAFALDLGLGDERTLNNLVSRYRKLKGFDTGIFGVVVLTTVLFERGYSELAYELITSDNDASFKYQMTHGATTLWEHWDGSSSHNHPMFGAVVKHFFYYILGIRQKTNSYGFENVMIEPMLYKKINYAEGYIDTLYGRISVSYKRLDKKIFFEIEADKKINAEFIFEQKKYPVKPGLNHFEFQPEN